MKKAIIFDLDGTLLDTLEDIGNTMNQVLVQNGYAIHAIDEYRYFVGHGFERIVKRALPKEATPDSIRAALTAFKSLYDQNWSTNTRPYTGIPELLDHLSQLGLGMAVLSNKMHDFTKKCVAELLAGWRFEPVIGFDNRFPKKPDPTAVRYILKKMDLNAEDVLFIGDSGTDMQTARRAGIKAVGVTWGFRSEDELISNGCQVLIKQPMDLIDLL